MRVLVYCANGLQGRPIVHRLLESGYQVRAMVKDSDRAAPLAEAGAEVVAADLDSEDLTALERAHADVQYVVLQLVSGDDGLGRKRKGQHALDCIRRARSIKGVVFNASVQYPKHIDELPGWVATREIEEGLRGGTIPVSIIRPTFYLQNLLLPYAAHSISVRDTIVYPVAERHALSWVGTEDIVQLIDHLLRHNTIGVSVLLAAGRRAIDGGELARSFSEGLGGTIRYQSLDLDQFEKDIDQAIGPGAGKRISAIFRFIERHPDDLAFVSQPFVQPPGLPPLKPADVTAWVRAHRTAFA